ncbi:hypothetical protein XENTR_v10014940 [Xenopus tropicalis]|nr:hypothetical protein XENTR_v10014940 [Xenopus tropicalis]
MMPCCLIVIDSPEVIEPPDVGMSHTVGQMILEQEEGGFEPEEDTVANFTATSFSVPSACEEASNGSESVTELLGAEGPSDSAMPRSLENFNLGKVLGEGTFGKVFLAEYKDTKQLCAIKTLKKERIIAKNDIKRSVKEW